ncbi:hypothetical protein COO16_04100 [Bacillus pseudomycoides]|uniref:hypothetical protein n=1 Tax=Bacillus pseudomycoides TaxID=64104 RepID=UPI000BEBB601|nr:hypothetical protein [Bacillus pseudomycoides]PDY14151.1 hypothetical protein COO16_04100 [Bacillus pseudomycoides]
MYKEFDYIFDISVYGEDEMNKVVNQFKNYKERHPFYISYTGIAPSVLHMNPSARIIFIKHKEGLRNTSVGLLDYLKAIVKDAGIEHRVGYLNS